MKPKIFKKGGVWWVFPMNAAHAARFGTYGVGDTVIEAWRSYMRKPA